MLNILLPFSMYECTYITTLLQPFLFFHACIRCDTFSVVIMSSPSPSSCCISFPQTSKFFMIVIQIFNKIIHSCFVAFNFQSSYIPAITCVMTRVWFLSPFFLLPPTLLLILKIFVTFFHRTILFNCSRRFTSVKSHHFSCYLLISYSEVEINKSKTLPLLSRTAAVREGESYFSTNQQARRISKHVREAWKCRSLCLLLFFLLFCYEYHPFFPLIANAPLPHYTQCLQTENEKLWNR